MPYNPKKIEVGVMSKESYVVIDTEGLILENATPDRQEIADIIEGFAVDKLCELGIEVSEEDVTKSVVEGEVMFVELWKNGTKFSATVLDHFSEPADNTSTWTVELRQY